MKGLYRFPHLPWVKFLSGPFPLWGFADSCLDFIPLANLPNSLWNLCSLESGVLVSRDKSRFESVRGRVFYCAALNATIEPLPDLWPEFQRWIDHVNEGQKTKQFLWVHSEVVSIKWSTHTHTYRTFAVLLDNVFVKSSHLISLSGLCPSPELKNHMGCVLLVRNSSAASSLECLIVCLFVIIKHQRLVVILSLSAWRLFSLEGQMNLFS